MIKTREDELFNACKNHAGFLSSQRFREWFHNRYPDKDQHHIFGSYTAIKTSDYCSVPVSDTEHQRAEKDKSGFFILKLPQMINIMIHYIKYLESLVDLKESES